MSTDEKILLEATLCFPVRDGNVLLGFKTSKIGKDCWNGYGGGIEKGERAVEAAVRELGEECGLRTTPNHLEKIAVVDFHNRTSDGTTFMCRVHAYIVTSWEGVALESDEMLAPTWFPANALPTKMMLADQFWLPLALSGKKIVAEAHYGPRQQTLLCDVIAREVTEFP